MLAEDYESPLPADGCARCSEPWVTCLCDPARPFRQPTEAELEAARDERLTRHELEPEQERG